MRIYTRIPLSKSVLLAAACLHLGPQICFAIEDVVNDAATTSTAQAPAHEEKVNDEEFWNRFLDSVGSTPAADPTPPPFPLTPNAAACLSPFGLNDRERLLQCYGEGSVVTAVYDSSASFASSLASIVRQISADPSWDPAPEFDFYVQGIGGGGPDCKDSAASPDLCDMLKCVGSTQRDVQDFVSSVLADPNTLPDQSMHDICASCAQTAMDADNFGEFEKQVGGGGSGAGFQLYCTDISGDNPKSTAIFTSGGGAGGGAGPFASAGSGGGAGMQILLENGLFDDTTACNGGGCGLGTPGEDGLAQDGTITPDAGCKNDLFVIGLELVKADIKACVQDPGKEISLAAGGGSGGGITDTISDEIIFRYSMGFRYDVGPKIISIGENNGDDDDKNDSGQGGSSSDIPCALAFADAVCENSGHLEDRKSAWELCLCPMQQLYAPQPYNCTYPNAPPVIGAKVDKTSLAANCAQWCPNDGELKTQSGLACTSLPAACTSCP